MPYPFPIHIPYPYPYQPSPPPSKFPTPHSLSVLYHPPPINFADPQLHNIVGKGIQAPSRKIDNLIIYSLLLLYCLKFSVEYRVTNWLRDPFVPIAYKDPLLESKFTLQWNSFPFVSRLFKGDQKGTFERKGLAWQIMSNYFNSASKQSLRPSTFF